MAARKPLVLGGDGLPQQVQSGDTLNLNAKFTGSAALPILVALGSGISTVTVAPALAGDSLAAGEAIVVTPGGALPAGLNIAYAIVTALNTVVIGFTATVAIALSSMTWTVVALRQ